MHRTILDVVLTQFPHNVVKALQLSASWSMTIHQIIVWMLLEKKLETIMIESSLK